MSTRDSRLRAFSTANKPQVAEDHGKVVMKAKKRVPLGDITNQNDEPLIVKERNGPETGSSRAMVRASPSISWQYFSCSAFSLYVHVLRDSIMRKKCCNLA